MKNSLFKFWKPLLSVIFWGSSFIATKIALRELAPQTIILLRLLLGVFFLLIVAVSTKRSFSMGLKNFWSILILSVILAVHLYIQITGLKYTTATNTGWIIGISPVFIAILGFLVFKENLTFIKISGIIIAFIGLLLLISKGNISGISFIKHKGDFLVLASAFTWSVYSIVNKKITIEYSPLMTILFLFIMVVVIISPFTINHRVIVTVFHLSAEVWASILFLGLFCSGVGYVLWAQALKDLEAAKVGTFLYFEPFVTVIVAWFILSEKITPLIILSGLIITIGVMLVNKTGKKLVE